MIIYKQPSNLRITKDYFSASLQQDLEDAAFGAQAATGILCIPETIFSKNENRKIIDLTLHWAFIMTGFIEFGIDDLYYVDYSDCGDEQAKIDELIGNSKTIFKHTFDKNAPKKININFEIFHDKEKDIELRNKI